MKYFLKGACALATLAMVATWNQAQTQTQDTLRIGMTASARPGMGADAQRAPNRYPCPAGCGGPARRPAQRVNIVQTLA